MVFLGGAVLANIVSHIIYELVQRYNMLMRCRWRTRTTCGYPSRNGRSRVHVLWTSWVQGDSRHSEDVHSDDLLNQAWRQLGRRMSERAATCQYQAGCWLRPCACPIACLQNDETRLCESEKLCIESENDTTFSLPTICPTMTADTCSFQLTVRADFPDSTFLTYPTMNIVGRRVRRSDASLYVRCQMSFYQDDALEKSLLSNLDIGSPNQAWLCT